MLIDALNTLAGVAIVGALFALAFIVPEHNGRNIDSIAKFRSALHITIGIWVVTSSLDLLLTLAELFDASLLTIMDVTTVRSYVTQTALGGSQAIKVVSAFALLFVFSRLRRNGGYAAAFLSSLLGVVAPLFQSHSSQSGSHGLAIGSLIIHLIAISCWFGSVTSLLFIRGEERIIALPRVSMVATWSLVTIVATGIISSILRLDFTSDWLTSYGALLIFKTLLLLFALFAARRLQRGSAENKVLAIEAGLLVAVISIGSVLSRFTPITSSGLAYDRVRDLVGISMPAEPNLTRLFFEYEADGLILGTLIFITALYIRGVVALARRGDRWPVGRTVSFAIGISLLDYATSGGLGLYAVFSFQYHMIAHMVISMIAPIAIVLGAPITLALRTLPIGRTSNERGLRGLAVSALHSRYSKVITHPIVALAIFDGSLFALYFTPLFGELMSSHFGHLLMTGHFVLAGCLFFYVIIGVDPNPRPVHHLARIVILLAAMSIHAFFSVALMSAENLIDNGYYQLLDRPWATDLLADQKLGAAIGWAMGEIPIVVALVAAFIQWLRADRREARRADKDDRQLAEYNEYLKRLAQGKPDS